MRVAVLTLTRDRLDYTKHCFNRLRELAGCDYDHYVLDQGSQDGTPEWLLSEYKPFVHVLSPENVGISRGLNALLGFVEKAGPYDAVVKFDNDCDPGSQGILRACAEFVVAHPDWLVSPRIEGLMYPPSTTAEVEFPEGKVLRKNQIGGIFLAAHASVYQGFRYDENNPVWGMDDAQICNGRACGYLADHVAAHHESTVGQHQRYGWYFDRRVKEGGPA